ncbi:uncharacterized protein SOCE26_076700 [Sorangium cellulosum]|uniref:MalT-like TPR region domain-containing protein n=1 Tax=Sorangium cellulosum TaxID=56 RepID=A0A2L0F3M2_SORCE|nr:hypothetical protein [Sorangium cellulosum]AUX46165.1 uncharacterized protein SOCE26_076700 [Sorangium cellulosum]
MDPITLAAERFRRQWQAFWSPPPGHERRGPPALRVRTGPSDRKDWLKALRWMEWQPDNRHPFVVVEAPFTGEKAYVAAIAERLEHDLAALRDGLAQDGLTLPPLASSQGPIDEARLRRRLVEAGQTVAGVLDGLVVVLAPARVDQAPAYRDLIARLVPASNGTTLRLAALDVPGSDLVALLPEGARFEVDQAALLDALKQMGGDGAPAPADGRPKLAPHQKDAVERALGRKIASEDTGASLRRLLLDGGKAMQDGAFKLAVRKLRAARMLCHLSGLGQEEAAASIALGSAAHAAGDPRAALAAFRQGKSLALAAGHRLLGAHAALGEAGVLLAAKRLAEARDVYAEVARLGEEASALVLEAMRMHGECSRLEGHPALARRAWEDALAFAESLEPGVRRTTSYAAAGASLAELLRNAGRPAEALATELRVQQLGATGKSGSA